MARTNYQHGKRLRELAKKQKREEKAQRRKERKEAGIAGSGPEIAWDAAQTGPGAPLLDEAEETDQEPAELAAGAGSPEPAA